MIDAMLTILGNSTDPLAKKIDVIDPQVGEGEAQCMDMLRLGAVDVVILPSRDFDVMMYEPGKGSMVLLGCKINSFAGAPSITAAVADIKLLRKSIAFPPTAGAAKVGKSDELIDTRTWTTRHFIAVNVCVTSDYAVGMPGVGLRKAVRAMAAVVVEEDGFDTLTLEDLVRLCSTKCKASISKGAQDILVAAALCFWSHPVVRLVDGKATALPYNPIPRWALKGAASNDGWLVQTSLGKAYMDQMKAECRYNVGRLQEERPYRHYGCTGCPDPEDDDTAELDFDVAGVDEGLWQTPQLPAGVPTLGSKAIEKWVEGNSVNDNLVKKMDAAVNRAFYDGAAMDDSIRVQIDHAQKLVQVKATCLTSHGAARRTVYLDLHCTSNACDVVQSVGKTICDPVCVRKHGANECTHRRAVLKRLQMHGLTGNTGGRTAMKQWWSVPAGRSALHGAVRMRDIGAKRGVTAADLDGMEAGNANGDPNRKRTRRRTSLDAHQARRAEQHAIIARLPLPDRQRLRELETTGGFHTRLNRFRDFPFSVPDSNQDD